MKDLTAKDAVILVCAVVVGNWITGYLSKAKKVWTETYNKKPQQ
jgi:hypothetical protein